LEAAVALTRALLGQRPFESGAGSTRRTEQRFLNAAISAAAHPLPSSAAMIGGEDTVAQSRKIARAARPIG